MLFSWGCSKNIKEAGGKNDSLQGEQAAEGWRHNKAQAGPAQWGPNGPAGSLGPPRRHSTGQLGRNRTRALPTW